MAGRSAASTCPSLFVADRNPMAIARLDGDKGVHGTYSRCVANSGDARPASGPHASLRTTLDKKKRDPLWSRGRPDASVAGIKSRPV